MRKPSCALPSVGGGDSFYGIPLRNIERKVFAASIAVVNQSISLFEDTVKDNITMWDTTIPEETYIQAAKDACIHDVITSRTNGYYSKVGEGGRNFSSGQRQRLEIARALATNPRIIVMDEATSALDAITEQTVDQNIRRRGCTSIIIAHRLSTIRDCDEIIVLDHGQIAQRGTHVTTESLPLGNRTESGCTVWIESVCMEISPREKSCDAGRLLLIKGSVADFGEDVD